MATRKFLFMNQSEGYAQEQGASDELSLGKITLSGVSGVALNVGGQLITNVGAPQNSNDAARKVDVETAQTAAQSYADGIVATERDARIAADGVLQGNIDAEALARTQADSALTTAIQNEATARANADTALQTDIDNEVSRAQLAEGVLQDNIDAEATARSQADTTLQNNIDAEATARSQADTTLQNNIDAEATARQNADNQIISDYQAADDLLEADYIARDVVVLNDAKAYADSLQSGFIVKMPAKAISVSNITLSGTQTVDGVALVAGDRILVAGQTDATKNGIYVVASGAWSRSSDLDQQAEFLDGVSVFIEQGTQYSDSTWVLITNNPIVLGTSDITFVQFSGLGQITAGDGLSKTGNRLDVNVGDGVAISADAVAVSLSTTPGLQFESGKLAAKPDASRGLAKDGSGLYVKHDGSKALAMDATNGLQVVVDGSKALAIDASAGLQVKADSTKGLAVDASAGLQIDLDSVPGLKFQSGKLMVKADSNNGIDISSSGVYVKYDSAKAMKMDAANGIQVVADSANGLAIDPTAGLQVKYDASKAVAMNSTLGLQVVPDTTKGIAVSASGVAVDLAANPGMQFSAGKLDLKLVSADRLAKSAAGLDVTGVPNQFKIGGSATSLNVSANSLNALTSSNGAPLSYFGNGAGDAYHSHTAQAFRLTTGNVAVGKAAYINGSGQLAAASCSAASTARVVGICVASNGIASSLVTSGQLFLPASVTITPGTPYYLGADGSLVEFSALGLGDRVIRLGFGMAAGTNPETFATAPRLHVAIQDMGAKA